MENLEKRFDSANVCIKVSLNNAMNRKLQEE